MRFDNTSHAVLCTGVVMEFPNGTERLRVLHGVDFRIDYGKITFLVGPSGSGKTTMLSILSGTLSGTAGEVEVLGERLDRMSSSALVKFRRRRIGFIFQQYNLIGTLTAAENAAIPLIADGMAMDKATSKASALLAELGLAAHTSKLPRQLSGGQQQRVAIARALLRDGPILLLDEATSALDAESEQLVQQALEGLMAGRTTLVIAHRLATVRAADRIIVMDEGRIVEQGTHDSLSKAGGLYARLARLQFTAEAAA